MVVKKLFFDCQKVKLCDLNVTKWNISSFQYVLEMAIRIFFYFRMWLGICRLSLTILEKKQKQNIHF